MANTLDLTILPINRRGGEDLPSLPGVHAASPPRRTARGRSKDRLILYLTLEGDAGISAPQQAQLLEALAENFYKTPGSVTSGLRAAAGKLNDYLLDRNLQGASRGQHTRGLMTMMVEREGRLTLGICGPAHIFVLAGQQSEHLHDPDLSGRGLGVSRNMTIYFSQVDLQSGGTLLVAPNPPATWTPAILQGGQGLEGLRRRLTGQAGPALSAILVQAQPGRGEVQILQGHSVPQAAPPQATPAAPVRRPPRTTPAGQAQPAQRPRATPTGQAQPSHSPPISQTPAVKPTPQRPRETSAPPRTQPQDEAPPEIQEIQRRPRRSQQSAFGPGLLKIGRSIGRYGEQLLEQARTLLGRMLPAGEEGLSLPNSWMAFIAIAVPLVVVTIAVVVWQQPGRAGLYEKSFALAQTEFNQTLALTDLEALRAGWKQTLAYLDEAEKHQVTVESQQLREQTQNSYDGLEGIIRLDFQSAITGGVVGNVSITRMVATGSDLYLLDGNSGRALRAWRAGTGYEVDPNFQCGPGGETGPLVDIAAMPQGNSANAAIVGLDGAGNLLYCIPGLPALSIPFPPPITNWGEPSDFRLDTDNFYVLDSQTNAVWVFPGDNGSVAGDPYLFFGAEIPSLIGVIDLAVNRDDLYLLHSDGRITACTYSEAVEVPTRCSSPFPYGDDRPGRESGPTIADANFTQILYTPPPGPSIFMLDAQAQAVYHFSLKLNLQGQYRNRTPLGEGPATAFAISPSRIVFIAVGDQVYYASLP